MKYLALVFSLALTLSGGLSANDSSILEYSEKLRQDELKKWDQSRFYGKLNKAKQAPKKSGLYKIIKYIQKSSTSNQYRTFDSQDAK